MPNAALELYESKLRAPWSRPGLVARTSVVDRLLASRAPITTVVAPPGYGKTTLLAQWWARRGGRSAWVSLDERDNDPAILLGYLAAALDRLEPVDPETLGSLASPGMFNSGRALPLVASMLSARREPSALVIDHLEAVENQESLDVISQLALHLPAGSQLAVGSRHDPPLPMARLRAQGHVVEIGVDDLKMAEVEARALLLGANVELGSVDLADLVARTEGWPVGLYLAALALNTDGPSGHVGLTFGGDDRLMADYLRSEILAHLSPTTTTFLRRTSVLDGLSGPLCDAVLGTSASRQMLENLERSNLLLVPLDRNREWYRYHRLFQDLLRAELKRIEPELVPLLHDRAAAWLENNGLPEVAIEHAQAAGDAERAARLFSTIGQRTYASGRFNTALRWRGWFEAQGLEERYPQVAMLGALADALQGRPLEADRSADIAGAGKMDGTLPDGSPLEAWVAVLDACLCRHGVERMRSSAESARGLLAPNSPWLGPALFAEALSYVLAGDLEAADPILAHTVDVCVRRVGLPSAAAALAEQAVVAIDRHDWPAAAAFVSRALSIVHEGHFDDYLMSILVFAVAARTAVHQGNVVQAREHVARAARLRPLCTSAFPVSTQFLLQLARAHLDLSDAAGARTVLRQVRDIIQVRPDLGAVPEQADELQSMVDTVRTGAIGASSLTVAELRLLPYLSTHFTFREIGERMFVSRHTVKSQAMSVYRKLGVSSRSEAIQQAKSVGLLDA